MNVYGYIGIITKENNIDGQKEALKDYAVKNNVKYKTVFEDKLCEKSYERPNYRALQQIMTSGDIVIIKDAERLGRNYGEIKQELQEFQMRGVRLLILDIVILQEIQNKLLGTVLQEKKINLVDDVA